VHPGAVISRGPWVPWYTDRMRTDAELLDAWRAGDLASGEALFERHFGAVARFFRNKLDHGVDDLVQRTFLACVEAKDRLREDSSFRAYLFGVAHNVLARHFRSQRRHGDKLDFGVTSVHDLSPSPSAVVAQRHEQRMLLEALRRIPLQHQIVLELYYWERLPTREVALVVGEPEGTIKTRIRRARRLLEDQLRELATSPEVLHSTLVDLDAWAESLRDPKP